MRATGCPDSCSTSRSTRVLRVLAVGAAAARGEPHAGTGDHQQGGGATERQCHVTTGGRQAALLLVHLEGARDRTGGRTGQLDRVLAELRGGRDGPGEGDVTVLVGDSVTDRVRGRVLDGRDLLAGFEAVTVNGLLLANHQARNLNLDRQLLTVSVGRSVRVRGGAG